MSWYLKELPDSRQEREDSSGARTASRTYKLWADDGTITEPLHIRDLFGQTSANGEQLPNYAFPFVTNGSLLAAYPEITPIDPSAQLWHVTWNYKNLHGGEGNPGQAGYLEWSSDGELTFKDKWRGGYSMPPAAYPTGSVPPGVEQVTGGQPNDSSGIALSSPHITGRIVISEIVAAPLDWTPMREAIGRRNSVPFGGFPAGSLLYMVPAVTKAGAGLYRREHRFAYDQDYHLFQVAKLNSDGKPILASDVDGGGNVTKTYAAVTYWVQAFPLPLYNFYAISPNFVGFA
jgi:hypothetical protein